MNTPYDIDLLEKYFDQKLNEQELKFFNNRLETDPEFRTLYDNEVNLHRAIRLDGLTYDLQYLKQVEGHLSKASKTLLFNNFKPLRYYAVAASIAAFILIVWMFPGGNKTPENLFEAYYKPYPNVFEPTLRSNDVPAPRTEAFHAYDRGDFQKAAALFNELLKEKQEPGVLLLLSNANLTIGNTAQAKENLMNLLNNFDDLDIQAKWYLSLCYMKEGNMEKSTKLLKELNQTEVSYAVKARELLKKVD